MLGQALKDSGFDGKVYTVDLSAENLTVGCRNIAAAGLSQFVEAAQSDSVPFLTHPPYRAPIAFAFLDSNHLCEHVKAEFAAIHPWLDNRSVVFFDNTAPHSNGTRRVHEALQEIQNQYGGNLINFPNTSWDPPGQAVWQRNGLPA